MTIYELALDCGLTTKQLEKILWNMGVVVGNREAALDSTVVEAIRERFVTTPAPALPTAQSVAAPTPSAPPPAEPPPIHQSSGPVRADRATIRVYEIAKRYCVEPSVVLERLEGRGLKLRDHLAWLGPQHIDALEADFAANPPHAVETTMVSDVVKRRRKLR